VGNTRSEEQNTILYSDLASKWNILEPINGISLNIFGYSFNDIPFMGLAQEYRYSYSPRRVGRGEGKNHNRYALRACAVRVPGRRI